MAIGDPTGADLASGTTDGDTLPLWASSFEEREVSLGAGVALTPGATYSIVVRATTGDVTNNIAWALKTLNPYANGFRVFSSDAGVNWSQNESVDFWFKTKAAAVEKDSQTTSDNRTFAYGNVWQGQTFIASSSYTITSVVLKLGRGGSPGTVTVGIRAVVEPGKATTPAPTDDQEDLKITGKGQLKLLTWEPPAGETPDYLIYFRAEGGAWVLQETITDDSTEHTLSTTVLESLAYYSIYEWRIDTRESGVTTTGDTWTFISQTSPTFTNYSRRSDYDADKVWQPGTGWVDINSFEFTGGGRYKGRVLVVGHKVIYFGDL